MDKIIINIITNGKEDLDTYNYEDDEYCDCKNCCSCYDEELEEYEYDEEISVEDTLEELLQDTLEDIENGECDCDECIYEKIIDMLLKTYEIGFSDGYDEA